MNVATKKHWKTNKKAIFGLIVIFAILSFGLYYGYNRYSYTDSGKISIWVDNASKFQWQEEESQGKTIATPYTSSFTADNGEEYKVNVSYDIDADIVKAKRETFKEVDGSREAQTTDYFVVRPIKDKEAATVHDVVSRSGKEYLGREYDSIMKEFGKTAEQTRDSLRTERNYKHLIRNGIFYSTDNEKWAFAGYVCFSASSKEKEWKSKPLLFGSYFIAPDKIINTKGLTKPAMHGFIAQTLQYSTKRIDFFLLDVQKDNPKSQRVAEGLGFEKNNKVIGEPKGYGQERLQRNMQQYILSKKQAQARFLSA